VTASGPEALANAMTASRPAYDAAQKAGDAGERRRSVALASRDAHHRQRGDAAGGHLVWAYAWPPGAVGAEPVTRATRKATHGKSSLVIKEREKGDGRRVQEARAGLSRSGYSLDHGTACRERRDRPITEGNAAAREEVSCARNGGPAREESRRSADRLVSFAVDIDSTGSSPVKAQLAARLKSSLSGDGA
jgi:hypothetical protein